MGEWEPCFVCKMDVAEGARVAIMVRTGAPGWVQHEACQFCASKIREVGSALMYVEDEWYTVRLGDTGSR